MPDPIFLPRIDSLSPNGRLHLGFHSLRATSRTEEPPPTPAPEPRRVTTRRWLAVPAVALLGIATFGAYIGTAPHRANVKAQVVSGTPSKKLTQNGKAQRWQQREIVVHVDRRISSLGPNAIASVEAAFATWMQSGADVPRVSIEVTDGVGAPFEPDGVNAIVLAPIGVPGHETDLAVTIGFSDSQTGEIVEADIIINEDYAIEPIELVEPKPNDRHNRPGADNGDDNHHESDKRSASDYERDAHNMSRPSCNGDPTRGHSCGSRYDLESIAAHEVGHFYGLGEDSDDGLATMFYCTSQCETHKRSLELLDAATMKDVYAGGYEDAAEVQCSIGRVGAPFRTAHWGAMVFASLGLIAASRRSGRWTQAKAGSSEP